MHALRRYLAPLIFSAAAAFAQQLPTFNVVDTSNLNATLGNAGKGVLDPQATGFSGIAFGANLFVATVNASGESVFRWATSPDGVTWTSRSQAITATGPLSGTSKIHFIDGQFMCFVNIATGGNFGDLWLYRSTDGLTWTGAKIINGAINVVEFSGENGKFVVAGTNGSQIGTTDLVNWASRPVIAGGGVYSHNDLAYGNGRFISTINASGVAYTSTDQSTWTPIPALTTPGGPRIEFGNGIFIGTSGGSQFRSTDGVNFTKITVTAPSATLLAPGGSPTFTSLGFIASTFNLASNKNAYVLSADGANWVGVGDVPSFTLPAGQSRIYLINDMVVGNGKLVLAGQDIAQTLTTKTVLPVILTLDTSQIPAAPSAPVAPTITTQPVAVNAVIGRSASFSVVAAGSGNTYQWRKDNANIAGATAATYTIASVTAASAGSYDVVITNSVGNLPSNKVTLSLVAADQAGRIINLSVLTDVTAAGDNFTLGYVVGGAGTQGGKPLVIRAAGPSLGALGVAGTLDDPKLETFAGSAKTGENNDWGGSTTIATAMTSVGAFPYTGPASKDAAVSATVTTRDNSVKVSANGNGTGKVIAEVYDATPSTGFTATTPRLLNVSVNKALGSGVTAGFVLGGTTPTRVLIRVVGPGLAAFGVGGTVTDPQLVLFNDKSVKIAENNDWGGTAELSAAFTAVGAFTLTPTSKDAALLVSLAPGNYSVQASGVNNTTGTAIVEVYEVP